MDFIVVTTVILTITTMSAYLVSKLIPNSFIEWVGEKLF